MLYPVCVIYVKYTMKCLLSVLFKAVAARIHIIEQACNIFLAVSHILLLDCC